MDEDIRVIGPRSEMGTSPGSSIPAFLPSAESGRDSSRFSVDSAPEAIVTLVRAADFKSVGGCGDTASAGSIPVRFRHFGFEDAPRYLAGISPSAAPMDQSPSAASTTRSTSGA